MSTDNPANVVGSPAVPENCRTVGTVTAEGAVLTARGVGRAQLPSTTLGLLMHAAEHSTRHVGQAVTTAKILA